MIKRIAEGIPFRAEEILFKDGRTLFNRVLLFHNRFIVVGSENDNEAPSMYNVDTVSEIRNVEALRINTVRASW